MNTHLKIRVNPNEFGLPGNRHHCAIANALMLADSDLTYVRVDQENIRFSRRSTSTRYEFVTPHNAAAFIREFDKVGTVKVKPFTLTLTDRDLIREVPQKKSDRNAGIVRAARKLRPELVKKASPKTSTKAAAKATVGASKVSLPAPRKQVIARRRPSQRV